MEEPQFKQYPDRTNLMRITGYSFVVAACLTAALARSSAAAPIPGLRAELRPVSFRVPQGLPVWVRFSVENTTADPITLTVPGSAPGLPSPQAGLPLSHVFSGGSVSSVSVTTPAGRRWDEPTGYHVSVEAPILVIAPHASAGVTVDLREYYPTLRGAGQFRITWQPYAGAVGAETVMVQVAPLKRAQIVTDDGTMTVRFFYGDAPNHVANFMDLVDSGFYNGKTFHRVEAGYLLQGGCPRGDGTGIRPDGRRLPAEFNSNVVRKGSVAMALLDDDPDSASCQFFICNTRQKDWDGRYTVFGELVGEESFTTLERLMATSSDDSGRPLRPVFMRTMRLIDAPLDDLP